MGIIDPREPKADALLIASGVDTAALQQWCDSECRRDQTLRDARRRGRAEGQVQTDQPGPPLPIGQHAVVHLLPVSLVAQRAWYLALGRADTAFNETEQERAALTLRMLHAAFDHIGEAGLERLLLGSDGRLIHADPGTETLLLETPQLLDELAEVLPAVVEQRWPALVDGTVHDVALTLAGQPRWVRFHRARAMEGLDRAHWYLELRPLDEDDIPPVGLIQDDRVAQAVAYLSDRYAEAPTLSDVAEAVHTSPFHFHRLFVRHVGRSPKHYLLRMQLMIAKWMLRATRTSIGDIAQVTGFASHGHFTATFHRMVGVSPSQFRETR
ncbi:MAG: helix-turn-helix transcriptional regulator [Phycisphaeraceae bacterium]